ncbi:MAG: hypothetical protein A2X36_04705 [Elusimicrobia bacterium GWA2_69_24]|nr:MAG: hypothetical protein A2X36_04705 [Elusimicrobia bacterium GWA2_69_24]HBL17530.1 hypothetical protein [Elusimicrobiota bacterium]
MNLLNLYFTPFATMLVLIAIYVSEPDPRPKYISLGILVASLVVNHWFSRNTYRFVGWASRLKVIQIWLTFLWSVLLAYLLIPYWAPMWLLLTMPPVTAALYQGRWQTLAAGMVCGLSVLGMYYLRQLSVGMPLGAEHWGQAFCQAAFIPTLSLFVHALAQTALRMRDMTR